MKTLAQRSKHILETLATIPGVEAATDVSSLPGIPGQRQTELRIMEGEQDPNRKILADSRFATVRRREVGLRLALGAQRRQIALRFLLQGVFVCGIGCISGLLLALASVRLLSGMLYGVSLFDPLTFTTVAGIVLLVAAIATLVPATRAARTDPMRVLREE